MNDEAAAESKSDRPAGAAAPPTELAARSRRELGAEATRTAVLEAATREFAARGLAGARVDRIAARAGVNKQALYYHFKSKDGLFQEALKHGYAQFRASVADLPVRHLPPRQALTALIAATFDTVLAHPELIAMICDENRHQGSHLKEVRKDLNETVNPFPRLIQEVIERGKRERVFRADLDPEQVYFSIISECMFYFSNSFTLSAVVGRDLLAAGEVARRKAAIVDFITRATLA